MLDLSSGNRDKGIERLERISFLASLSHNGTLTFPLLQLNIQQALNQTINALLNEQLLDPNDPYIDFDEGLKEGSPLLPQPIRWFNQGRQFLGRLKVAIPKVK